MNKEELIKFLKERLEIRVDTSYRSYSGNDQMIEVGIWLDDVKLTDDYAIVSVPSE